MLIFRHQIAWNLRPSMQITIIRVFINYCNKPPPTSSKPIIVPHCTTTIFIQVQNINRSCRTKWLVCLISPNVYICPLLSRPPPPPPPTIQLNYSLELILPSFSLSFPVLHHPLLLWRTQSARICRCTSVSCGTRMTSAAFGWSTMPSL